MKEKLRTLEQYVGKPLIFVIKSIKQYMDEGDEITYSHLNSKKVSHILKNIHLQKNSGITLYPPRFISVSTQDNKDILIPFSYRYVEHFELRRRCEKIHRNISEIRTAEDIPLITITDMIFSYFFDGYKKVTTDGGYTSKYTKRMQNYPELNSLGCRYEQNLGGITGNIRGLLEKCKPLWDE